jgi:hypothetical protein
MIGMWWYGIGDKQGLLLKQKIVLMQSNQDKVTQETILQLLEELKASGGQASLFVDQNGLSSESGIVVDITDTEQKNGCTWIMAEPFCCELLWQ